MAGTRRIYLYIALAAISVLTVGFFFSPTSLPDLSKIKEYGYSTFTGHSSSTPVSHESFQDYTNDDDVPTHTEDQSHGGSDSFDAVGPLPTVDESPDFHAPVDEIPEVKHDAHNSSVSQNLTGLLPPAEDLPDVLTPAEPLPGTSQHDSAHASDAASEGHKDLPAVIIPDTGEEYDENEWYIQAEKHESSSATPTSSRI